MRKGRSILPLICDLELEAGSRGWGFRVLQFVPSPLSGNGPFKKLQILVILLQKDKSTSDSYNVGRWTANPNQNTAHRQQVSSSFLSYGAYGLSD